MMGNKTNNDSVAIMELIDKHSVGAEIGVWYGSSSRRFLGRGVSKLYLVDAWHYEPYKNSTEHGDYESYLERYKNICGGKTEKDFKKKYDEVYKAVVKEFGENEKVVIERMTSDKWFAKFDDELDWIYVDGDHSYEGCLRDLESALKVVKKGGLILGDDYQWPKQKHGKPGVTKAVDEFLKKHGLKIEQHGKVQFSIRI